MINEVIIVNIKIFEILSTDRVEAKINISCLFSRYLSTFKNPHQENQIYLISKKHNYCLQNGLGFK